MEARGTHGLSCRHSASRSSHLHFLNDMLWRAITRTGVQATKEPNGLFRADGKRPDGLTLVLWREGRSDVTVADTVAESYLSISSITAGAAAERKNAKYAELGGHHIFIPIAIETLGPFCVEGLSFIREIGRRTTAITSYLREAAFLFQRLSVAV
jgi:hypothetical protein